MNTELKNNIKILQQCVVDCRNCLTEMAGTESFNDCPLCCIQCIDACEVVIKMITSKSNYMKQYALLCAEICDYCADHCDEHSHEHCKLCAKTCRECAKACRDLAA